MLGFFCVTPKLYSHYLASIAVIVIQISNIFLKELTNELFFFVHKLILITFVIIHADVIKIIVTKTSLLSKLVFEMQKTYTILLF